MRHFTPCGSDCVPCVTSPQRWMLVTEDTGKLYLCLCVYMCACVRALGTAFRMIKASPGWTVGPFPWWIRQHSQEAAPFCVKGWGGTSFDMPVVMAPHPFFSLWFISTAMARWVCGLEVQSGRRVIDAHEIGFFSLFPWRVAASCSYLPVTPTPWVCTSAAIVSWQFTAIYKVNLEKQKLSL